MEIIVPIVLPLLILICVLALIGSALWNLGRGVMRTDLQYRLRRERKTDTYGMFAEYFEPREIPEQILKCVYNRFANEIFLQKRFPVRPGDSLEAVFAVAPDGLNDLDLLIRELAGKCGMSVVPSERKMATPTTVEELVLYLAAIHAENQPERDKTTLLRSSAAAGNDVLVRPTNEISSDVESLMRPLE